MADVRQGIHKSYELIEFCPGRWWRRWNVSQYQAVSVTNPGGWGGFATAPEQIAVL
jgi:hypothetical protein